jgi:hypothetical protein
MDQAEPLRRQMRVRRSAVREAVTMLVTGPVDPGWRDWFCAQFADAWQRLGGSAADQETRAPGAAFGMALNLRAVERPEEVESVPADELLLLCPPHAHGVTETYVLLKRWARRPGPAAASIVFGPAQRLLDARRVAQRLQGTAVQFLHRPVTVVGFVLVPVDDRMDPGRWYARCMDQLVLNYRRIRHLGSRPGVP